MLALALVPQSRSREYAASS